MRKRWKLALGAVAALALGAGTVAATTGGDGTAKQEVVTDTPSVTVYVGNGDPADAPGTPVAPVELTAEEQARAADSSPPSPHEDSGTVPDPEKDG